MVESLCCNIGSAHGELKAALLRVAAIRRRPFPFLTRLLESICGFA
jgi:hypothetical protein